MFIVTEYAALILGTIALDQHVGQFKVSKGAKIKNRYNQVLHLT